MKASYLQQRFQKTCQEERERLRSCSQNVCDAKSESSRQIRATKKQKKLNIKIFFGKTELLRSLGKHKYIMEVLVFAT